MEELLPRVSATKMPERVIAVLGMHRSGTSCLTGSLQKAGLFLGDCHTWNKHNERGNRENQQFVDLHDAILAENGGAWDMPPARVHWSEEHLAWGERLLAAHANERNFGFKDPRALLVIDGWRCLYPAMEFVGIYRHPNAVAKSLAKRSSKSREQSLELWYGYNSILYREYSRKPFPVLCFDLDEAALDEKILAVASRMGLKSDHTEERFYTSELRHNDASGDEPLPEKILDLLNRLKAIEF